MFDSVLSVIQSQSYFQGKYFKRLEMPKHFFFFKGKDGFYIVSLSRFLILLLLLLVFCGFSLNSEASLFLKPYFSFLIWGENSFSFVGEAGYSFSKGKCRKLKRELISTGITELTENKLLTLILHWFGWPLQDSYP